MKKKILVIAPSSFPVTNAESIVNIKLLRALSEDGRFDIDLVSKKSKWSTYPSAGIESYGVQCNISTVEVDNKINFRVIWQNLMSFFKFGTVFKGCHWAFAALPQVTKLINSNHYDYVLTKDSPAFLLGWYAKYKYGLKWVASWNDPFPYDKYPKPYGKGQNYNSIIIHQMTGKMKVADIHIFPSLRLANYMNGYLHLEAFEEKCIICPHVVLKDNDAERHTSPSTLKIIHSGNLQNPRSPQPLLKGLRMALDREPKMKISISILGKMSSSDEELSRELGVSEYVKYLKPIEYNESLLLLSGFHISAVIEADCDEGIFMPTKVSDCMQQGIPIFAISPLNGNLNDLYQQGYIHYFADVRSPESVSLALIKMYKDFEAGVLPKQASIKVDLLSSHIAQQYFDL